MTFRLANVRGRAALVSTRSDGTDDGDEEWYDLKRVAGGVLGPDPMAAVAAAQALHDIAVRLADHVPDGAFGDALDAGDVGPPVPHPTSCFGVGLNYRSHAEETGREPPATPLVFGKFPSCLVGPRADVELRAERADWEVELVVVIGPGGRDIPAERAWEHVAGLTAGQDISDRALQFAADPPHFDLGKSRDTYGPTGPVLVSTDAFADPADLGLTCDVNGERRQSDRTSNLIFDVPALIAHLSGVLTLHPGDLIFTGTPAGVGAATGRFLAPGDEITSTIEGIGTLVNRCTAGR
ncbi:MAG: fumarylacetoacetate hydrolase family protein [Ilumatobacteraceae bacterium]